MLKFIVTKELGRLARWLRMLGFDTVYYNSGAQGTLVVKALSESRVVVTRSKKTTDSIDKITVVINSNKLKEQLKELIDKLHLSFDDSKMFTRCTVCNERLESVEKKRVKGNVPEYVFNTHNEFMMCPSCGKVYWQGTHWGNIHNTLNKILC